MQLTEYDKHDFAKQFIELDIGLLIIFHEFIFFASTISENIQYYVISVFASTIFNTVINILRILLES